MSVMAVARAKVDLIEKCELKMPAGRDKSKGEMRKAEEYQKLRVREIPYSWNI